MPGEAVRQDFLISRVDQLEAISDPTRRQIVSLLEVLVDCSIPELAQRLGRTSEALYHHVRALEKVGLIEASHSEPTKRRPRATYRLVGTRLVVDRENRKPRYLAALTKAVRAAFRFGERLSCDAIMSEQCTIVGPSPNTRIQQLTCRLDDKSRRRAMKLLNELDEIFLNRNSPNETNQIYTITYGLAPVIEPDVNQPKKGKANP